MRSPIRLFFVRLLAALTLVVLVAPAAAAGPPQIQLDPEQPYPGSTLTVSGSGWAPGSQVEVDFLGFGAEDGLMTVVDGEGSFVLEISVPADTPLTEPGDGHPMDISIFDAEGGGFFSQTIEVPVVVAPTAPATTATVAAPSGAGGGSAQATTTTIAAASNSGDGGGTAQAATTTEATSPPTTAATPTTTIVEPSGGDGGLSTALIMLFVAVALLVGFLLGKWPGWMAAATGATADVPCGDQIRERVVDRYILTHKKTEKKAGAAADAWCTVTHFYDKLTLFHFAVETCTLLKDHDGKHNYTSKSRSPAEGSLTSTEEITIAATLPSPCDKVTEQEILMSALLEGKEAEDETNSPCWKCGKERGGAQVCPHCGADAEEASPCGICGEPRGDASICPHCGME